MRKEFILKFQGCWGWRTFEQTPGRKDFLPCDEGESTVGYASSYRSLKTTVQKLTQYKGNNQHSNIDVFTIICLCCYYSDEAFLHDIACKAYNLIYQLPPFSCSSNLSWNTKRIFLLIDSDIVSYIVLSVIMFTEIYPNKDIYIHIHMYICVYNSIFNLHK